MVNTRSYTTYMDNQDSVEVQVYQGERPMVADNVALGKFLLRGIEPALAGQPEIVVTFRVDENGILEVTGKDVATGVDHHIRVTDSVRLGDEEIQAMIRQAREHHNEDRARFRETDARYHAELWRMRLEKIRKERLDLPAELLSAIEEALAAVPTDWTEHRAYLEELWQRARQQEHSRQSGADQETEP